MNAIIRVSAVVLRDEAGRIFTVRKYNTNRFMLVGGKPEPGENPLATAIRECREETGIDLAPGELRLLGSFDAPAANEPGHILESTVFVAEGTFSNIAVRAEIEASRWLDPNGVLPGDLAPMLVQNVLPALERTRAAKTIAIYCGSATGANPEYARAATELATAIASRGDALVYGGGKVGLMGAVADAALAAGGLVTGVMPRHLVEGEISHDGLSRLDVVDSMPERKGRMLDLADAFVALPGGTGTLEELFEAWTWGQLGLHQKPIVLYDVAGFWHHQMQMLGLMVEQGFISPVYLNALIVVSSPDELFEKLEEWQAPPKKWSKL